MSNKELFKAGTRLKYKEWKSPTCEATFNIYEPNAGQAIELSRIMSSDKSQTENGVDLMAFVWTNMVVDPETGKAFTPQEYRELLKIKDIAEMMEPVVLATQFVESAMTVPTDVMQKNLAPTPSS